MKHEIVSNYHRLRLQAQPLMMKDYTATQKTICLEPKHPSN